MCSGKIPLHQLTVAKPCSQTWSQMRGDDRRRFCEHCQRHVHNLSALTEREIQKLLARTNGRLCAGFVKDDFGRLITAPERGAKAWLARKFSFAKFGFSSAIAALTALSARAADKPAASKDSPPAKRAAPVIPSKPTSVSAEPTAKPAAKPEVPPADAAPLSLPEKPLHVPDVPERQNFILGEIDFVPPIVRLHSPAVGIQNPNHPSSTPISSESLPSRPTKKPAEKQK